MILQTFLTQEKHKISEGLQNSEISGVSSRDIEIIFCEVLQISDIQLITESQKILTEIQISEISERISERISGKSISEIFQKKMFFGEEFFVTNDVLTPRPETEFLVEYALQEFAKNPEHISGFMDIGTGSGCIITSIAKNILHPVGAMSDRQEQPEFLAADISEKALEVAKKNFCRVVLHTTEKVTFRISNLLANFSPEEISGKIIVTNLPYIPQKDEEWMDREVLGGDPHLALFSGETGTDLYQEFFLQLKKIPDFYMVIFEYDPPQTPFFQKFLEEYFPEKNIEFFPDLSGELRFGVMK